MNIFCRLFHRRWITWHGYHTPARCEKCDNGPRWQWHLRNQEQSNKDWKNHLREVGRLW